jgi:mRNA interferase HigB
MKVIGKRKLTKLAKKNIGNVKLQKCIASFEKEITESVWTTQQELESSTVKFDSVHSDGFYIADINIHRAMVAITFVNLKELEALKGDDIKEQKKKLGEVDVLWVGTHHDYQRVFGNNKDTVEKWLRSRGYIS